MYRPPQYPIVPKIIASPFGSERFTDLHLDPNLEKNEEEDITGMLILLLLLLIYCFYYCNYYYADNDTSMAMEMMTPITMEATYSTANEVGTRQESVVDIEIVLKNS